MDYGYALYAFPLASVLRLKIVKCNNVVKLVWIQVSSSSFCMPMMSIIMAADHNDGDDLHGKNRVPLLSRNVLSVSDSLSEIMSALSIRRSHENILCHEGHINFALAFLRPYHYDGPMGRIIQSYRF